MGYIKLNESKVGQKVILTEKKESLSGYFEVGSVVTITDVDRQRGYTFTDEDGNRVTEAGFTGFCEL